MQDTHPVNLSRLFAKGYWKARSGRKAVKTKEKGPVTPITEPSEMHTHLATGIGHARSGYPATP